tara:strand:+ start:76 stop:1065 length:990 start_codon:yes stop_codon:yes gene_type:complete
MIYKSYLIEKEVSLIKENMTLIYGENIGIQDEIKRKIKSTYKDAEILLYNQEEILKKPSTLITEISNVSLFEKEKIILVDQVNDKITNILEELSNLVNEQKIYFFTQILDKKSKLRNYFEKSKGCAIVPCYIDNEQTLRKIILEKLKDFKGLNTENINLIVQNVNLDRSKLYNELDKITTFFENKTIDIKNLEKVLNIRVNEDINLIRDAALMGDKIKTNRLLSDTIFDTDKNIFYLNVFSQRLDRLKEISKLDTNMSDDQKVSMIKPQIFWKDKPNFITQTKKWNGEKIRKKLKEIYDLEINFKSNNLLNKEVMIKKFIVDICVYANS